MRMKIIVAGDRCTKPGVRMTGSSFWGRTSRCFVLSLWLAPAIWMPVPAGAESEGVDLQYQLSTDLTSTAHLGGTYGGLEDSFRLLQPVLAGC
jgi:hypothetical protein